MTIQTKVDLTIETNLHSDEQTTPKPSLVGVGMLVCNSGYPVFFDVPIFIFENLLCFTIFSPAIRLQNLKESNRFSILI